MVAKRPRNTRSSYTTEGSSIDIKVVALQNNVPLISFSLQLEPKSLNISSPAWREPRNKPTEHLKLTEQSVEARLRSGRSIIAQMIKSLRRPSAPRKA
jgi:hypothetical protein